KALDSQDYREWLKKHGADDAVLYSSPVRQVYVIYESYPEGEVGAENPSRAGSIGAWLALRTLLPAVLDYRGAPVWLPKTSVGEAVVAPLYQILKKRGVKFKFFHKIKQVVPDTSRQTIDHIILAQQVTLKPKAPKSRTDPTSYDPLVDINGRLCWPNQPLYEQLKQGQALQDLNDPGALESYWTTWEDAKPKVKLTQGKDFDLILLGISIGALSKICEPSFYKPNDPTWQKWHAMLTHIPAISLQSCQLWFNRSLRWKSKALCMSGFANLFNSALDTTEVITKWENWGELKPPKAGINFVTPLPTNDLPPSDHHWFPHEQQELVRKNVDKMLHEQAKYLWPRAKAVQGDEEQGFEYEFLYNFGLQNVTAYSTAKNPAATVTQYWKAVINPSDRYNLALPGSEQYRLKSGESGFQNLYLAGDWIDNEHFNVGCTEATVISGLAACKAISGTQRDVIGFELEKLIRSLCEDLDWETYETITEGIQTLETIVDTVADDLDLFEVVEDDPGLISKIETIGLSLARPSLRHIQKSGGQFVGTSLSYIAPLPVSSQRLTSLLPDSLVLAPQPFTASGEHPFLLIFSKQRSLSFTPLQSLVPLAVAYDQFLANYFDIGYLQMMGVIPFVKPKQSENRVSSIHSYISHMFVNQRLPAIGGEIYGQSTRLANIGLTKNSYYVDDLKTHAPIISGDFVKLGRQEYVYQLLLHISQT
ncbi:MAG: FAD-dependent oxidoreductase, partial [Chloroflexota bacterium]